MKEIFLLIETIGEAATLRLVEEYGGTRIKIFTRMPKKHKLRDVLGQDALATLIKQRAGEEIHVPIARRWRFEMYRNAGITSPREIARRLACSENTVYGYLRGDRRPSGQLVLSFE